MRSLCALTALAAIVMLAACGEKPQTLGGGKSASKPWDIAPNGFVAAGWTPGDKASWEQTLRTRAQGQNEYVRVPTLP